MLKKYPNALMLLVILIWGSTFVGARTLAETTSPLLSAFLRFFIACLVLAIFALKKDSLKQAWAHRYRLFLMGLCGVFFYSAFFFYGFQFISASRGSLIVALNPVVIALAGLVFFKERISTIRWFGIVVALVGVAIVLISKDPQAFAVNAMTWKGDLLLLGCVASWATYSIVAKPVIKAIGPLQTVFYAVFLGTLMLGGLAYGTGSLSLQGLQRLNENEWFILVYLGAVGSALSYVWYYQCIHSMGATRSGAYIALVPIMAVALSALLLNETISLAIFMGGIMAIVGVFLSSRK